MKKALPVFLSLFQFCLITEAQIPEFFNPCSTPAETSEWLARFQLNPAAYESSGEALYLPLTLHLVGTNEGEGHFPLQEALGQLCQLNAYFEETQIQFFLEGSPNYHDHSDWYQGNQLSSMMAGNNVDNTLNCYIIQNLGGFSGMYSSSGDAVLMAKWGFNVWNPLFAHEIGHYLSLPHTFWGWENQEWDLSMPAPEFAGGRKVERVDGEDCDIAGDGFCDTPPDYLSAVNALASAYACNINDESFVVQTDPTGATFRTDCSLIMSYASNPNRFSDMQISAMRANIEQVRPYLLYNQDPLSVIPETEVALLSPSQGAMVAPDEPATLEWAPVPNATHYVVDITFLPVFSAVYDQYVVEGTSLVVNNLLPGKNYRWRVRPYNAFHTCPPYSEEGQFSTGEPVACDRSEVIGTTVYDLQTNASVCNRISRDAEGNIMATWTMSLNGANGYADRGTGYNRFDAASGSWEPIPTQRLEPDIRTGWPNHIITDNGTELIVTHEFTSQGIFLRTLRRAAGDEDWIEGELPVNAPRGAFAARMACSGETVHLIAVTPPLSFGGVVYEGVNGHVLYYRSPDGGATWDITDAVIPGLDEGFMASIGKIDCYNIDARGEVVAVGVFSMINDVYIFKSENSGTNWTSTRIYDFPIDRYQFDQGYTVSDLPPPAPEQPHPLAIFTTDGSGSLLVDHNGLVHAFYGQVYLRDNDIANGNFDEIYTDGGGLAYWNETFGPDSTRTIAGVPDLNGNNAADIDFDIHLAEYFLSPASIPSPGVDENNNLYLAYSAVMEGADFRQNDDAEQYRHIVIIHSEDGGEHWSEPFDAINETTLCDAELPYFSEAMYPSMVRDITDEILFTYQESFRPGASLIGDPPETSFIRFARVDLAELGVVKTQEAQNPNGFNLRFFPNPATGMASLQFELEEPAQVGLGLYNVMGQPARADSWYDLNAGEHTLGLEVAALPSGGYFVWLQVEGKIAVVRMVKD